MGISDMGNSNGSMEGGGGQIALIRCVDIKPSTQVCLSVYLKTFCVSSG